MTATVQAIQTSKQSLLIPLKDAVKNRTSLSDDDLGVCIESYGCDALLTLKMCMPLVDEMKRRFKNLDRKKQVNGQYQMIRGCRTFQNYCEKVLHRTEQAVYKMLRGGEPPEEKKKATESAKAQKAQAVQEIKQLADAIPSIHNGKAITPPSEYSAADIVDTIAQFTFTLVNQNHVTDSDTKIVYTSLIREFRDILDAMEKS